tara:strand:- start:31 stop:717 length:687 start_codon:yes stop_codon:yes gene_type:complete
MSFATVAAVVSAGVGVAKAIQGGVQAKKAKKDAAKAKIELEKNKNIFSSLDTSNPYQNMENTMEDLTVNTQAAEFSKQQSMQGQANIMQGLKGAAGGSGIAALAQSMAQQGSMDAQKSSASIAQQEQANQKLSATEASRIQGMERSGEVMSRNMEMGKVDSLMGMAAGDLVGARQRQQAGQEAMMDGVKDVANSAVDYGVNKGHIDPNAAYDKNVSTSELLKSREGGN